LPIKKVFAVKGNTRISVFLKRTMAMSIKIFSEELFY
jgi:hypothetical protein